MAQDKKQVEQITDMDGHGYSPAATGERGAQPPRADDRRQQSGKQSPSFSLYMNQHSFLSSVGLSSPSAGGCSDTAMRYPTDIIANSGTQVNGVRGNYS